MRLPFTRRTLGTAAVAVLAGAIATVLIGPRPPVLADATTGDSELADQVIEALGNSTGYHGISVAVIENDDVRFAGLGHADHNAHEADHNTRFEIGSIPKAFTGMVLADLVDSGEVTLDQRVGDLVPGTELATTGEATLAELASHRSGLPRMPSRPATWARAALTNFTGGNPYTATVEDVLDWAGSAAPAGGADPSYSNFGVATLGNALARSQGISYEELVTERLLKPVQMTDTVLAVDDESLPDRRAAGYSRSGREQAPWLAEGFAPAGLGYWSSTRDLSRLALAVLEDSARGVGAVEPRWDFDDGDSIGLGWITSQVNGRTITWHNGGTGGFRSFIGLDREADRAVVLLSNTTAPIDDAAFDLLTGQTS